jgi:L-alanine-DL-glutamate epimerase-like enolase superfamily enzyme
MEDGYLNVPNTPGIGVEPIIDYLDEVTTYQEVIK